MSREHESRSREPWQPNQDFFRSTPRSAEIHMVCGAILKRLDRLQHNVEVAEDKTKKQTLYAELEMLGGRLIELDIKPKMNQGLPLDAYQSNPVTAVEWAAGQILPLTGRNIISESDAMPIAQEFNILDDSEDPVVEAERMPERWRNFAVDQQLVTTMHMLLDIPSEKPEE